jgi:iron complex outermembrane recepter protein
MKDPFCINRKPGHYLTSAYFLFLSSFIPLPSYAETAGGDVLDEVTITATRSERESKSVPSAISSMGEEKLDQLKMNSISDALQDIPGVVTYSKNGLSSAKLIIRGAGLKARYGIREIMVLRDGIPLTEPDSFTRLDTIDGQDIERLEVTRGPGNMYASGSAGGTIHIITKSVFDQDKGRIKIGINDDDGSDLHLRTGGDINENQALSVTFSHRELKNSWRKRNEQSSDHLSIKHGLEFGEDNVLETELGFAKIDMELSGGMDEAMWEEYKRTGEQNDRDSIFKHTGRFSENIFFNTKAEIEMGDYMLEPKLYYSQYHHYHPVTGFINDNSDNPPNMLGAEVAVQNEHQIGGRDANTVFGIAYRVNTTKDAEKYTYRDVYAPSGSIEYTESDAKGELAQVSSTKGTLLGIFASEHLNLSDRLSMDLTARVDDVKLTIDENTLIPYNYRTGNYDFTATPVTTHNTHDLTLGSASIGLSYELTKEINTFISLATADQIPADSELDSNPDLKKSSNTNIEIGLKGRSGRWSFDTSIYDITGKDEVIQVRQPDGESQYVNAGQTSKQGLEFSGQYAASTQLTFGAGLNFTNYKYDDFQEEVRVGRSTINVDRSGNYLPLIPRQQTNVFVEYQFTEGFSSQIKLRKDGEYYMDNANSEKWADNKTLADLNLRYVMKQHKFDLTVSNLTDERYALEVSKDTSGDKSYQAGAPRAILFNYTYSFGARS